MEMVHQGIHSLPQYGLSGVTSSHQGNRSVNYSTILSFSILFSLRHYTRDVCLGTDVFASDFFGVTAALCRGIRSSGGDVTHEWKAVNTAAIICKLREEKGFLLPLVILVMTQCEWKHSALCCVLSLAEWLPVLLEVFMMCGLLRRLSLDTILNLNLPLLACKQESSYRQDERHSCVHLI